MIEQSKVAGLEAEVEVVEEEVEEEVEEGEVVEVQVEMVVVVVLVVEAVEEVEAEDVRLEDENVVLCERGAVLLAPAQPMPHACRRHDAPLGLPVLPEVYR